MSVEFFRIRSMANSAPLCCKLGTTPMFREEKEKTPTPTPCTRCTCRQKTTKGTLSLTHLLENQFLCRCWETHQREVQGCRSFFVPSADLSLSNQLGDEPNPAQELQDHVDVDAHTSVTSADMWRGPGHIGARWWKQIPTPGLL